MSNFNLLDESDVNVQALKIDQQKYALQFQREKTALKYYMLGKGYSEGIKALGFIERIEFNIPEGERFRKDGITPSLHHQIRIALAVTQLKDLPDSLEESCIICALLHDTQEDHNVSSFEIVSIFGNEVSENVWSLTRKFAGEHKNKDSYIKTISQELVPSIVKGLDRCDNLEHMINVFSVDKMDQYTSEAETIFLPMLKTAMKLFPEYLHAYQSITLRMKHQIKMSKYIISAKISSAFSEKALEDSVKSETDKIIASIKNDLEKTKLNYNERNKKTFLQLSNFLKQRLANDSSVILTKPEIVKILTDLSIELRISTLDFLTFASDELSEGTSIG